MAGKKAGCDPDDLLGPIVDPAPEGITLRRNNIRRLKSRHLGPVLLKLENVQANLSARWLFAGNLLRQ
jgi:hypothetical protein